MLEEIFSHYPDMLSENQAAEILNQNPATLRHQRCRGKGPRYFKIGTRGKTVRYLKSDILALLQEVHPNAAA